MMIMMIMYVLFGANNSQRYNMRCFFRHDAFGPVLLKSYLIFFNQVPLLSPVHRHSLVSFYMNTNLNAVSKIHLGI